MKSTLALVLALSLSAVSAVSMAADQPKAGATAKSPSVTATRPANLDWELRNR
jgi:hypothetical protein